MSMIPVAPNEQSEVNSLEQQIRAEQQARVPTSQNGPNNMAQANAGAKGHQARTTPHKDGMTYGERGDVTSKKTQPMKAKATTLKAFAMRPK